MCPETRKVQTLPVKGNFYDLRYKLINIHSFTHLEDQDPAKYIRWSFLQK